MISDRIEEATEFTKEGNLREAADLLARLAEEFPPYVTPWSILAQILSADGRYIEAWNAWQHAHFLAPSSKLIGEKRRKLAGALISQLDVDKSAFKEEEWDSIYQAAVDEPFPDLMSEKRLIVSDPSVVTEPASESINAGFNWSERQPEAGYPEISWQSLEETLELIEPIAVFAEAAGPRPSDEAERVADSDPVHDDPVKQDVDDLDELIEQLENAPRIVPADAHHISAESDLAEEDSVGDLVSETLARIYAGQKQYVEAAQVYEKLAAQHPERAAHYLVLADEMNQKNRG